MTISIGDLRRLGDEALTNGQFEAALKKYGLAQPTGD